MLPGTTSQPHLLWWCWGGAWWGLAGAGVLLFDCAAERTVSDSEQEEWWGGCTIMQCWVDCCTADWAVSSLLQTRPSLTPDYYDCNTSSGTTSAWLPLAPGSGGHWRLFEAILAWIGVLKDPSCFFSGFFEALNSSSELKLSALLFWLDLTECLLMPELTRSDWSESVNSQ